MSVITRASNELYKRSVSIEKLLSFDWHVDSSPRLARAERRLSEISVTGYWDPDENAKTGPASSRESAEGSSEESPNLKNSYQIHIEYQYKRLTELLEVKQDEGVTNDSLTNDEEKELMTTRDMKRAAELVLKGLAKLDRGK